MSPGGGSAKGNAAAMTKSFFSSSWYRVAGIKPRLAAHAQIHRQRFRGQTWYVLQDYQSGQFHRLSPAANQIVCMMNGRRSVQEIWDRLSELIGDVEEQPTQDEVIRLLAQLHQADLLHGGLPPDMDELADRSRRRTRRELLMRATNPMAVRIPLFDPERFLARTMPIMRPVFTTAGFVVWLLVVGFGAMLAIRHWQALTSDALAHAFATQNLLLMVIVYPLIKAIHELGHGYAAKAWGGEVHELGIMLLVLMPVPYIDASSASAFQQKWRRALVSAAGIMIEALLAALAMIFWVLAEPGLARAIAFNVVLIGGVSTLLFNGNPLLRFDGYYALCDVIEIPNLGSRSNRYFFYLTRRWALGMRDEDSPPVARGEAGWFLFYAIVSFLYRLFIMITIALFIASQLFFFGVMLAVLTIVHSLIWPIVKGLRYLATAPAVRRHRGRAIVAGATAGVTIWGMFFLVPLPYSTVSQGVVLLPESSFVPALTGGFVTEIKAVPGQAVVADMPLIQMQDIELHNRLAIQMKTLEELKVRKHASNTTERIQARLLAEQIRHTEGDIALTRRQLGELTIRSTKPGRFIMPRAEDWPGRFVPKGQTLAYIVAPDDPVVRVAIEQARVDLVLRQTRSISVRLIEDMDTVLEAHVVREVPMARKLLPSAALSTHGGGQIVSEGDAGAQQALEGMFKCDLALSGAPHTAFIGTRAYVRFDHGRTTLAARIGREVQQLFLRRFGV